MNTKRTHQVTTTDGVTIGGTVHGDGPPVVFLQGAVGDGDLDWARVAGHLADRFTCHLPNLRGRGLSGDHPDLGPSRIVEDYTTYVDSIGEPVGLVGWSGGGYFALGVAAARPDAVAALAPWEPGFLSLLDEAEMAAVGAVATRTAELVAGGDLAAASRTFLEFPFDEREIAVAAQLGYVAAAARYVPKLLDLIQQDMKAPRTGAIADPAVLGTISVPVRVLVGAQTKPFFVRSARHIVDHVPGAHVREIPGAAHAAPLTHPEALAEALADFFTPARLPA